MNLNTNLNHNILTIVDVSHLIDFDAIEKEYCKIEWTPNVNNVISLDKRFLDKPELEKIKKVIETFCKNYLNEQAGIGDQYTDLIITNSWVNLTEPKHAHHMHTHGFSVLSGVIFLDDNPANFNLHVEAILPPVPHFVHRHDNFVSLGQLINPIKGPDVKHLKHHLLIFLSNLKHQVAPTVETAEPRRTISFNTFWKGLTGDGQIDTLRSHVF